MTRLGLSLLVLAFFVLCAAGMRQGWRNRQRGQSYLPPLSVPPARFTAQPLAGKAMGIDGLLVVRWRLGEHLLDTGVRGDDKDDYGDWIEAIHSLATRGAAPASSQGGDDR